MFYHLTYEGAVNIDSVPDPAMKAAILAQINHFGQTPRQLFLKSHPKRKWIQKHPLVHTFHSYHLMIPQVFPHLSLKSEPSSLNQIYCDAVCGLSFLNSCVCNVLPLLSTYTHDYHEMFTFFFFFLQEIRTLGTRVSQIMMYQDKPHIVSMNRVLRPPIYDKYVVWGFPDRSLRFMSYDQDKVLSSHESLHDDGPVTCAGFSRDGQILVTGMQIIFA